MPGFLERLRRDKEFKEAEAQRRYEIERARQESDYAAQEARQEQIRRNLEVSRQMFERTQFEGMVQELISLTSNNYSSNSQMKRGIVSMERESDDFPGAYGISLRWNKRTSTGNFINGGRIDYDQLRILVTPERKVLGIGRKTHSKPFDMVVNSSVEQEEILEKAYKNPEHVIEIVEPYTGGI